MSDPVRIKHPDPTARFSPADGPDEQGGYLVAHERLADAVQHGWAVVHLHEEPAAEETDSEKDPAAKDSTRAHDAKEHERATKEHVHATKEHEHATKEHEHAAKEAANANDDPEPDETDDPDDDGETDDPTPGKKRAGRLRK